MLRTRSALTVRGLTLACAFALATPMLLAHPRPKRERASCRLRVHAVDAESSTFHRARGVRFGPSRFSAYETSMLEFDLLCRDEPPIAERMWVDVHLPEGELYRSLTLSPIEAEGRASKRQRWRLRGAARFPVRGTFVTQSGLFGDWSAKLCWEVSSRTTCAGDFRFELDRD